VIKRAPQLLLWFVPLIFLGLFYFYPLSRILTLSFSRAVSIWQPFVDVFGNASFRGVLWFTFWQASLSTLLTLTLGLPAAYLLARFRFRGKAFLRALSAVPFVLPTLVVASAFDSLLGPRGWVNLWLVSIFNLASPPIHFVNSLGAILVAHVFYNTTIVLRLVGDFWARLGPQIEQAASVLGASPRQVLTKVTLPMLAPALSAATLLVFIFDFTSFGVILVLGGPRFSTLETEIYYQTVALFDLPVAATLALVQLLITVALTVIYTRLSAHVSRPQQLRAPQLGARAWAGRGKWLVNVFLAALVLFFVSPLAALAGRSITRLGSDRGQITASPGLTLDYYKALAQTEGRDLFFAPPAQAIQTSAVYAGFTISLALFIGLPAAWVLARREKAILSRILDPVLMLPLGTSAVTLGLGFLIGLDFPPLNLRASILLVPLAHTLVALPFVVRSLTPALRSIRPRLHQAAEILGASPGRVIRHVDIPLVGRALMVAALFAFAISIGEFGATALVARPEFPTIPVLIFRLFSQPGDTTYGQAMALSTILMLVTAGGMLLIERFRVADIGEF
jgi:thiamine transport system permease protein